jgi:hypothetical protein
VSLESTDARGRYITVSDDVGLRAPTDLPARQRATLLAVTGIADPACFSFRAFRDQDSDYLRHSSFRLRTDPDDGTVLFRRDATFCSRPGSAPGSIALESENYPGFFVRHLNDDLWIDQDDGSAQFRTQSSFFVRGPLSGR